MRVRRWSTVAALVGLAGAAAGQNEVIYEVDQGDYEPDLSTAPALAVGKKQIVAMGSHRMIMFNKSIAIDPTGPPSRLDVEDWGVDYAGYPFETWSNYSPPLLIPGLTFPRADYDPITRNVWLLYSEAQGSESNSPFIPARPEIQGGTCVKRLHLAASKHPYFNTFDTTDSDGFEYVTGTDAVNLGLNPMPFRPTGGGHDPYGTDPTYPSFGFDTDHVFIAAMDNGVCAPDIGNGYGQTILILPRQFGTPATSVHAGGIPQPSDFTIIRTTGQPLIEDDCFQMLAVQEPYEQYGNVTLFISTDGAAWIAGSAEPIEAIRLRGVFRDGTGTWQVRQSLEEPSPTVFELQDADIPVGLDDLVPSFNFEFPDDLYPEAPNGFRATVENEAFQTAVLTEDNQGNPRVFAVHAALTGSPTDRRWAVQWYVIDPAFGPEVLPATTPPTYQNFHAAAIPSDDWQPTIVAAGRITTDGSAQQPATGDCYHPVLGVTRSGQVFIEYTFSNATTNQRILRAQLGNSYNSVAATTVLQVGPSTAYASDDDRWALYGDMQADPTECKLWSTHTLVEDAATREVWLFEKGYTCFTTNLNADEGTDPYDMLIYNDLFLRGLRRADTDADDVIDATDMATFIDAYNAATRP